MKRLTALLRFVCHCRAAGRTRTGPETWRRKGRRKRSARRSFRTGFQEIVDDLNKGSLERFQMAIDQDDMLERIYGLRLIDQKVKKQFSEDFETSLEGILKSVFAPMQGNIRAAWLGFGSKGDRGKAIVRYDLPDFQFTYHEYELRLDRYGRVEIVDWIDFLEGSVLARVSATT